MIVTEGITGYWHYHLSKENSSTKALCGASVMFTTIGLAGWKIPFGEHFPKRPTYCDKCDELYRAGTAS